MLQMNYINTQYNVTDGLYKTFNIMLHVDYIKGHMHMTFRLYKGVIEVGLLSN